MRRSHKRWREQHARKTQAEGLSAFLTKLPEDVLQEQAIVVKVMEGHEHKHLNYQLSLQVRDEVRRIVNERLKYEEGEAT